MFNLAAQNVAVEDGFDLLEDNELVVDADFGVLSNDRFGQGNILAVLDKAPTNGSIEFRNDGSFRYLPTLILMVRIRLDIHLRVNPVQLSL